MLLTGLQVLSVGMLLGGWLGARAEADTPLHRHAFTLGVSGLTLMIVATALLSGSAPLSPVFLDTVPALVTLSVMVLGGLFSMIRLRRQFAEQDKALRIESSYYEQLFDASPEAIVLLDDEDRVLRTNREFERLFGYTQGETVGARINDLIVPHDRQNEGLSLTYAVASGQTVRRDTDRMRRDGSMVPVSILATPFQTLDGQTAVYGIYRDISERIDADAALRLSEQRYRSVLDSIADAYYEVDLHGRFLCGNPALGKLLGLPNGTIARSRYWRFVDRANADKLRLIFGSVHRSKRPVPFFDCRITNHRGEVRYVEGSVTPVFDDERNVVGFRGMVTDVTERKEAELATCRLWAAIEASIDGVAILDESEHFIYVNGAHVKTYGYDSSAEFLGKHWRVLYADGEHQRLEGETLADLADHGTWRGESIGKRRNGSEFPKEISLSHVEGVGYTCIVRDISERKTAEAAVRTSEERYALAARGAAAGLWDWDLIANEFYYSPRWKEQLGLPESEVSGAPGEWFDRVHPDDVDTLQHDIALHLRGETSHLENEHRICHSDGDYRWVLTRGVAVRGPDRRPTRMAGSQTDITTRRRIEEQLQHDVNHDPLTGLPNRNLLLQRLTKIMASAHRRTSDQAAVLFIDLDRFKVVNDSLGHGAGDELLSIVANRLKACVRPGDTIARLGGDEFVLLMRHLGTEGAGGVAERIHRELSHPIVLNGQEVFTSASIGISICPGEARTADELLSEADAAMYRAKAHGKARHAIYTLSMHRHAAERLQLESDLRRALERDEFVVHYQPIVSLDVGRLHGFEALIRWEHPARGHIAPGDFIPIAEETGLIVPIGEWVLERACRQMREWQELFSAMRDAVVHVNLSGRQFAQSDLVERVSAILHQTELPAPSLALEITESVVMDDVELATNMLAELRDLDVRLQVDDFGTGYSSLSYLNRFPLHTLKIDRSFVIGMTDGEDDNPKIVRLIASLARDLQMDVIAEGIETTTQIEILQSMGCHYGQGHFIARAAPPEAMGTALLTGFLPIPLSAVKAEQSRPRLSQPLAAVI